MVLAGAKIGNIGHVSGSITKRPAQPARPEPGKEEFARLLQGAFYRFTVKVQDRRGLYPVLLNLFGAKAQGLFPAHRLPASVFASHRPGDPIRTVQTLDKVPDLLAGEA
jgi:hypothetical protein